MDVALSYFPLNVYKTKSLVSGLCGCVQTEFHWPDFLATVRVGKLPSLLFFRDLIEDLAELDSLSALVETTPHYPMQIKILLHAFYFSESNLTLLL